MLGRDCKIGVKCSIKRSIIGKHCTIGDKVCSQHSPLGTGTFGVWSKGV